VQHAYLFNPVVRGAITLPLSGAARPEKLAIASLVAVAGSILLTLSAKISIPFYPVPLTMTTFVVIVPSTALRPGSGVVLWHSVRVAGLLLAGTPEKGIGLAYMMGPTGGYLLGYLVAAYVAGTLAERGLDRSPLTAFVAALIASAVIYVPGVLWLGALLGWDQPILAWGLTPFILLRCGHTGFGSWCFGQYRRWWQKGET
jgi:biotin transport system substrate-specific component